MQINRNINLQVQNSRGRTVARTTCRAPKDRAVLDFSKESRFVFSYISQNISQNICQKNPYKIYSKNIIFKYLNWHKMRKTEIVMKFVNKTKL